jgi:hypothetical protein
MQGLGSLHFAMALHQALGAYAGAAGDGETAVMAGDLLGEKLEATHRLRPLLPTAAAQAAG